uniref:DNA damage-regulated autophagy modulator protein 1-like isoform X2 n=1 Tax=Crassostrea virginica TaxID=6565 RepID=A0A8B8ERN2_CRAVI|nr:DNA damage-regulated autophagy modulator protein 1-like isoform X2 [Crassostrea virginica]
MFLAASWCFGRYMWILPIITLVWLILSMGTTYGIAVALNHTFPDFPYISYTGVEVPERGIFTFSIAVTAIMLAANAEMRFLFVKEIFREKEMNKRWKDTNTAGLILGLISSFGLLLVGCFQVDVMKPPHYFGAFLCFVVAIVYLWLQTVITWKLRHVAQKQNDGKVWRAIRLFVWIFQILNSAASTILLILFSVSKTIYKLQRKADMGTKWDTLRDVFLLSTSTEWLLAFSIMVYVLTFIPGFKRLRDIKVKVTVDKGGGEKSGAIPNGDQQEMSLTENQQV